MRFLSTASIPKETTLPLTIGTVTAVLITLFVIVVGVVILVVLFRTKKRKQQLEVNKLQNVEMENEIKLKQEMITNSDLPPYAEIQTEAPPHIVNNYELMESSNQSRNSR